MNSYELMVIFTPVLSNEEFKAAQKNLKKLVTDHNGEVVGEDASTKKPLACITSWNTKPIHLST
jgi:small subunit ribosomal protein S6